MVCDIVDHCPTVCAWPSNSGPAKPSTSNTRKKRSTATTNATRSISSPGENTPILSSSVQSSGEPEALGGTPDRAALPEAGTRKILQCSLRELRRPCLDGLTELARKRRGEITRAEYPLRIPRAAYQGATISRIVTGFSSGETRRCGDSL